MSYNKGFKNPHLLRKKTLKLHCINDYNKYEKNYKVFINREKMCYKRRT